MKMSRHHRGGASRLAALVAILVALCLSGCASRYEFGHQSRRYFTLQRVSPRGATGAPAGLDSEEAAMIHAGYRQSLAPEGYNEDEGSGSEVLVISEDGRTVGGATRGRNR